MTNRIDFYLLSETEWHASALMACRLTEKAFQQEHQVYLHLASAEQAQQMDEVLWSFRDDSFLPHGLSPADAPIQIGYSASPPAAKDVMINLTATVPDFYQQFARILEIIPNEESLRQAARQNYRFYQTQNCQLFTHK